MLERAYVNIVACDGVVSAPYGMKGVLLKVANAVEHDATATR